MILINLIEEVKYIAISTEIITGQLSTQSSVNRLDELLDELKSINHCHPHKTDHSAYDLNKNGSFTGGKKL